MIVACGFTVNLSPGSGSEQVVGTPASFDDQKSAVMPVRMVVTQVSPF